MQKLNKKKKRFGKQYIGMLVHEIVRHPDNDALTAHAQGHVESSELCEISPNFNVFLSTWWKELFIVIAVLVQFPQMQRGN